MRRIERIFARIAGWIDTYFAASAVVWSLADRRRPEPPQVVGLGIDPRDFLSIGHG